MYWYSIKNTSRSAVMAMAIAALFLSCSDTRKETVAREDYFDIPSYFKTEIARLTQEKPLVDKTVVKDSLSETREVQIADWENELSSFASIDLNKPVYAGVLTKDSTANKITLTSSDPKIDLELVEIQYNENGAPAAFRIQRNIQNSLYETQETLNYTKDKGYSLEKKQSVFILGDKYYHIEGLFKSQTAQEKLSGR